MGYADEDARRFGQYNGVNESGAYGLLDFNFVEARRCHGHLAGAVRPQCRARQPAAALRAVAAGQLGLLLRVQPDPALRPVYRYHRGDRDRFAEPHHPDRTDRWRALSILKTRRDNFGFGFDKVLFGNWDLQVRFRNEEKDGTRVFARGTTGTGPAGSFGQFEFAPEPINSTTRQLDVKIGYTGHRPSARGRLLRNHVQQCSTSV